MVGRAGGSSPGLGYFPNAKTCWLIVKPCREEEAIELFAGTAINVTIEGQKHLGALLGSRSYLEEYVNLQCRSHKLALRPSLLG